MDGIAMTIDLGNIGALVGTVIQVVLFILHIRYYFIMTHKIDEKLPRRFFKFLPVPRSNLARQISLGTSDFLYVLNVGASWWLLFDFNQYVKVCGATALLIFVSYNCFCIIVSRSSFGWIGVLVSIFAYVAIILSSGLFFPLQTMSVFILYLLLYAAPLYYFTRCPA